MLWAMLAVKHPNVHDIVGKIFVVSKNIETKGL
jgi:hypothetical protein